MPGKGRKYRTDNFPRDQDYFFFFLNSAYNFMIPEQTIHELSTNLCVDELEGVLEEDD